MTTTTTGSGLEHVIGPHGLLSIRLRDGRARLRAVDGDSLRIRDGDSGDLAACSRSSLARAVPRSRRRARDDVAAAQPRRGPRDGPPAPSDLGRRAGSADLEVDGLSGDQRYRTRPATSRCAPSAAA